MAGLGSRFRAAGIDIPKPLITVDGKPMFARALDSFAGREISLTVVVRQEDEDAYGLRREIYRFAPDASVVVIPRLTRGAVETAAAASNLIDHDGRLIIMDCDIAFASSSYFTDVIDDDTADGGLLTFSSRDPRYSFVEVARGGDAVRAVEKVAISDRAIMGAYYFRRAGRFFQIAAEMVERGLDGDVAELYVSGAVNRLIADGGRVRVASGDFYCFGTPEELAEYERTGRPVGAA